MQFIGFGSIKRSTVRTKETGESKGYGFVDFDSHEAAEEAVSKMNGTAPDPSKPDLKLKVERALKKTEIQMQQTARGSMLKSVCSPFCLLSPLLLSSLPLWKQTMMTSHHQPPENLYVKNLDDSMTEEKLRTLFAPFGTLKR